MPRITVKGTTFEFPNSSAAANWSPAVIETIQAIADAVNIFTGTFDVAPQTISIDTYNPGVNIAVDNLIFPPTDVRAVSVFYTVHRKTDNSTLISTDGVEIAETGTLELVYNNARSSGTKWEISRMGEGDAFVSFSVSDLGQILFTTENVSGINHTGILSYRALSILNG